MRGQVALQCQRRRNSSRDRLWELLGRKHAVPADLQRRADGQSAVSCSWQWWHRADLCLRLLLPILTRWHLQCAERCYGRSGTKLLWFSCRQCDGGQPQHGGGRHDCRGWLCLPGLAELGRRREHQVRRWRLGRHGSLRWLLLRRTSGSGLHHQPGAFRPRRGQQVLADV